MQYDNTQAPEEVDGGDDEVLPLEERLTALRSHRNASGYSPQARARIEYLQELRRLRSQVGDDGLDAF
ncbi:MAG: hypothetical protein EA400_10840 [Chromatiaceae bacterium]|nr:MAG: hypothetical protein EA400_10840 [Chromatiaceae bacterium]